MAYSKARRLSDSISATGEISAFVDGSITHADLHTNMDLTGKTVLVPNASTGDSDTTAANTAFVQQEIAALVDSAPGTLNTLNELAAALGDDASFSTTVTNSIALKAPLASPDFTGQLQATNSATTTHELIVTGNNTRSALSVQSKDASGGAVDLRMHSLGDGPRGEIFTYTNHDLAFATNNVAPQMILKTDGKFGIGRTDPTQLLEVHKSSGGDQTVAKISAHNYGDTGKTFIEIGTEYGDGSSRIGSFNDTGNSSVLVFDTHSATSGQFTERMRITSSGNVGIGTTNPTKPLHVAGSGSTVAIAIDNTGTGGDTWRIWSTNDAASDGGGKLGFYNEDTTTRAMTLDSSGNVGIGTSSPADYDANAAGISSNLVVKDSGHSGIIVIAGTGSDAAISFGDGTGAAAYRGAVAYVNSQDALYFKTASSNRMIINSSGHLTPAQQHTYDIGGVNAEVRNIYAQGLYVGGSAAANKLDDYEEGTWTPAIYTYSGVTTSSISTYGIYTKIGNICHIHAKITVTLSSLPGQIVTITGLPFTATNTSDTGQRSIIAIGGDSANLGSYANGRAHFRTNGAELQGVYMNSGSTAYWNYNGMDSSTWEMHVHGFYTTT